MDRNLELADSK